MIVLMYEGGDIGWCGGRLTVMIFVIVIIVVVEVSRAWTELNGFG